MRPEAICAVWVSFCALKSASSCAWIVAADMVGSKMRTFGPKFGVSDWVGHTPDEGLVLGVGDGLPVGEVVGVGLVPPVWTTISNREYPNWVARVVPSIRTYRPVPVTLRVCVPPVPV